LAGTARRRRRALIFLQHSYFSPFGSKVQNAAAMVRHHPLMLKPRYVSRIAVSRRPKFAGTPLVSIVRLKPGNPQGHKAWVFLVQAGFKVHRGLWTGALAIFQLLLPSRSKEAIFIRVRKNCRIQKTAERVKRISPGNFLCLSL